MEIAVIAYDGMFDSGLAAILDVLNTATSMAQQLSEAPRWNLTTVGFDREARTAAGHVVYCEPVEFARRADLLIVPAVNEFPVRGAGGFRDR